MSKKSGKCSEKEMVVEIKVWNDALENRCRGFAIKWMSTASHRFLDPESVINEMVLQSWKVVSSGRGYHYQYLVRAMIFKALSLMKHKRINQDFRATRIMSEVVGTALVDVEGGYGEDETLEWLAVQGSSYSSSSGVDSPLEGIWWFTDWLNQVLDCNPGESVLGLDGVERVVNKLDKRAAKTILMRLENYTRIEIAEEFGIQSVSTAMLYKATRKFCDRWDLEYILFGSTNL